MPHDPDTTGTADPLDAVKKHTRRYERNKQALDDSKNAVEAAIVDALKAGYSPAEVVPASPFSDRYVRGIARSHGLAAAKSGPKPKARPRPGARSGKKASS